MRSSLFETFPPIGPILKKKEKKSIKSRISTIFCSFSKNTQNTGDKIELSAKFGAIRLTMFKKTCFTDDNDDGRPLT